MRWFSPQDHSAPVIHREKHAQSKYPGQPLPALPRQAVVFCLGKGLPLLQERFAASLALDQLPGFITHSPVYQVEGAPHTCFLHGGYGAPQAACTVETLHALVKGVMIESYLEEGCQPIEGERVYGKSITDPCLGWEDTERLLLDMAERV